MEKIRIQFNAIDYQVYHNYCLRYYSILDTTRKRSIHLILELFEKELFPIGEHDLREVELFFSKKCAELGADYDPRKKNTTSMDLPLFRVCREIPFIIGDFEKIYRLIEKTGIAPNYLLIVATFSTLVEEENTAFLSAINDHDRKKAELIAPGIADIIRTQLGSDNDWESVLYELTRIVRKFNLASPDQKIDQNCIYLIGPAVVSHFNADIGYAEIQSTLERYFKERELAVFEALLNNKPYLPDQDTDSEISDNLIFKMLKSISSGELDQKYLETVSDPGLSGTVDLPAVISQSDLSHDSDMITQSGQPYSSYPIPIQENYPTRFAIDIGNTLKSLVVLPEKKIEPPYAVYTKPGIPLYSLLFMGVVILILLAVTMAATSGIWSPVKPQNNSSTEISDILSIVENLQKNATLSAKNNQTVYLLSPPVTTIVTVQPVATKKGITTANLNKHFFAVAFGPDNTKINKRTPEKTLLSMAVMGDYQEKDLVLLQKFTSQFNNYSTTDKFHSDLKFSDQASIVITFSSQSSLDNIEDLGDLTISKNPSTGVINYLHMTVTNDHVSKEVIFINSDLKGDKRTHWILRGLLDNLGFPGETYDYPDSIFYAGSETTTRLSDLDWKAVQLMYGSKITPGMTSDRVKALLPQ
ncbi:MAG: DUF2927 domain-containing protein [Methanoregula sp.]